MFADLLVGVFQKVIDGKKVESNYRDLPWRINVHQGFDGPFSYGDIEVLDDSPGDNGFARYACLRFSENGESAGYDLIFDKTGGHIRCVRMITTEVGSASLNDLCRGFQDLANENGRE